MKFTHAVALSTSISLALADTFDYPASGIGAPLPSYYSDTNIGQLNSPNATNTVNFTFFGESWALRVNITELGHTGNASYNVSDPHIVMSTYDLQWPNTTATLNETAIGLNNQSSGHSAQSLHPTISPGGNGTVNPLCMYSLSSPIWPNVTNKLQDENSSDCEGALGQSCLRRILTSMSRVTPGSCPEPHLFDSEECEDVFGRGSGSPSNPFRISEPYDESDIGYSTVTDSNGSVERQIRSLNETSPGESVHWQTGAAYSGSNETVVREAASQFRMVIMSLGDVHEAVCMRVDTSIDDEEVSVIAQRPDWRGDDSASDDNSSNNSGDDGDDDDNDDESTAIPQMTVTVGNVAFAGIVAVMFGFF